MRERRDPRDPLPRPGQSDDPACASWSRATRPDLLALGASRARRRPVRADRRRHPLRPAGDLLRQPRRLGARSGAPLPTVLAGHSLGELARAGRRRRARRPTTGCGSPPSRGRLMDEAAASAEPAAGCSRARRRRGAGAGSLAERHGLARRQRQLARASSCSRGREAGLEAARAEPREADLRVEAARRSPAPSTRPTWQPAAPSRSATCSPGSSSAPAAAPVFSCDRPRRRSTTIRARSSSPRSPQPVRWREVLRACTRRGARRFLERRPRARCSPKLVPPDPRRRRGRPPLDQETARA